MGKSNLHKNQTSKDLFDTRLGYSNHFMRTVSLNSTGGSPHAPCLGSLDKSHLVFCMYFWHTANWKGLKYISSACENNFMSPLSHYNGFTSCFRDTLKAASLAWTLLLSSSTFFLKRYTTTMFLCETFIKQAFPWSCLKNALKSLGCTTQTPTTATTTCAIVVRH